MNAGSEAQQAIQLLRCPICWQGIQRCQRGPARYGTQINMVLADLQAIKLKIKEKEEERKRKLGAKEKQMVVKAMGPQAGHWFKCLKGHPYYIGECGGAMQESSCPECGALIGGQRHSLARGNRLASEMDGATASAYPGMSTTASEEAHDKPSTAHQREFLAREQQLRQARQRQDGLSAAQPLALRDGKEAHDQGGSDPSLPPPPPVPGPDASPAEVIAYQDWEYEWALRRDMIMKSTQTR